MHNTSIRSLYSYAPLVTPLALHDRRYSDHIVEYDEVLLSVHLFIYYFFYQKRRNLDLLSIKPLTIRNKCNSM